MVTSLNLDTVDGHKIMVGVPGQLIISSATDARVLLESCFETGARDVLLFADNLAPSFFDLSSGMAGEVLQKMRTYGGMRLAVVSRGANMQTSLWFAEMESEERRKGRFGLFASADEARSWLAQTLSA